MCSEHHEKSVTFRLQYLADEKAGVELSPLSLSPERSRSTHISKDIYIKRRLVISCWSSWCLLNQWDTRQKSFPKFQEQPVCLVSSLGSGQSRLLLSTFGILRKSLCCVIITKLLHVHECTKRLCVCVCVCVCVFVCVCVCVCVGGGTKKRLSSLSTSMVIYGYM